MGKIYLEMNYRSTGSILATAHGIISQGIYLYLLLKSMNVLLNLHS